MPPTTPGYDTVTSTAYLWIPLTPSSSPQSPSNSFLSTTEAPLQFPNSDKSHDTWDLWERPFSGSGWGVFEIPSIPATPPSIPGVPVGSGEGAPGGSGEIPATVPLDIGELSASTSVSESFDKSTTSVKV